jgi:hypothetical protein
MANINFYYIEDKIFNILQNNIGKKVSIINIYKELISDKKYNLNTYNEKNYFDYIFLIIIRTFNNKHENIKMKNNKNGTLYYISLNNDINVNNNKCNSNNSTNLSNSDNESDDEKNSLNSIDSDILNELHSDTETDGDDSDNYVDNTNKYYFEINNFIEKQKNKNEKQIIDFIIDNELEEYYLVKDYKGNTVYHYLCFYNDIERFNKIQENIKYTDLFVKNNSNYQVLDFINHNSTMNKNIHKILFKELQQKDKLLNEILNELRVIKPKVSILYNVMNLINISLCFSLGLGFLYNKFI